MSDLRRLALGGLGSAYRKTKLEGETVKVLFFNPPKLVGLPGREYIVSEECCWGLRGCVVVPYQLLATATWVHQLGHRVGFIDYAIEKKGWPDVLGDAAKYDYVVASLTHLYERHLEPLREVKNLIAISIPEGYHDQFEKHFHPKLVAWNDPEYVIARFLQGETVKQPCDRSHFAEIPAIDYSLYPYHRRASKVYTIQVTRDCLYRCNFCVWGGSTLHKARFVLKDPRVLVEELGQVQTLMQPSDKVFLLASQITSSLPWLRRFAQLKAHRCEALSYYGDIGIGEVTEEVAQLLKATHLTGGTVGAEALSDGWLRKFNKPWTFKTIKRGLLLLEKYGVTYHLILRFGVGETREDIAESMRNLEELVRAGVSPEYVIWGRIVPYEGTRLADQMRGRPEVHPLRELQTYVDRIRDLGWKV